MEPRNLDISKFGLKDDQRRRDAKFDNTFGEHKKNLFDTLVNMVVNHKMELQKIPATSHIDTATVWAEKRGLRAGQQDFDRDGHPETVVYNKAGQPFIVNGYKLKASDYPVRHAYWGSHQTSEERAGEPMREWVMNEAYEEVIDAEKPWKRTVNVKPFGHKLKEWGYRMPTKPKKQISVFSHFCKLIAPYVKTYFESDSLRDGLGGNANESSCKLLKKIISPITMYRMLYMKIIERYYMFYLREAPNGQYTFTYKQFKEYCKKNSGKMWVFYMENILDNFENFKDNIVYDDVIARLFIKDDIDFDFNDPDDAIIFFMGKKNMEDDEFSDIILNNSTEELIINGVSKTIPSGDAFLHRLEYGDKQTKKQATKTLEKWKTRAREGTKKFFEDQVVHLMENAGAYQRFKEAYDAGLNPIDPDPSRAQQASPTRSREEGNATLNPPIEESAQPAQGELAPEDEVL